MDRDIYDSLYSAYLRMNEGKQELENLKKAGAHLSRRSSDQVKSYHKERNKMADNYRKSDDHGSKADAAEDREDEKSRGKHQRMADRRNDAGEERNVRMVKHENQSDNSNYAGSRAMDKVAKRQGDVRKKAKLKSKFRGSNSGAFSRPD